MASGAASVRERDPCPQCMSFDPAAPLSNERFIRLRNPLGFRTSTIYTDFRLIDQYGLGRVALVDRSIQEVGESTEAGCCFCKLLLDACSQLRIVGDEINIFLEKGMNPRVTVWDDKHNEPRQFSFELFISGEESPSWNIFHPLSHVSSRPTAPEAMSFLKKHLSQCVLAHAECKVLEYTPKRLLEVDLSKHEVRLVQPKDQTLQRYTALSYCWGPPSTQVVLTTTANIKSREAGIKLTTLPRTIIDAVYLTDALGVEFLWIDALCIIQDDPGDWAEQASQMANVYKGAYLVIAAGSSAASSESFLHVDDRPTPGQVPFSYGGQFGMVFCMPICGTGIHEDYQGMYGGKDPLDHRAWALQERVLATRLIAFSKTELQWVCQNQKVCEAGHRDSAYHNSLLQSIPDSTAAYHFWHKQVAEFTTRGLRYASDKLPALSGIASRISLATGSRYVAGLWLHNLVQDLCWERFLWESRPHVATSKWRAPTFSWASVEGNVFYNDEGLAGGEGVSYSVKYSDGSVSRGQPKRLAEILEMQSTPVASINPFGEVSGGYIKLRAPLKEALLYDNPKVGPDARYRHIIRWGRASWECDLQVDVPLEQCPILYSSGHVAASQGETALRAAPGKRTLVSGAKVWLLNLGSRPMRYNSHIANPDMWLSVIVLGKSQRVLGAYERLGFKHVQWPPLGTRWSQEDFSDLAPFATGQETTELEIV